MSNTIVTPWMNLPNPVPSIDPGPDWASNLYACIVGLDQHNHSSGFGQAITPNGININGPLSFNTNSATNLVSTVFLAQSSVATLRAVYVIANDLYYNDGAGNIIQLTSGGLVNATASGISSGTASAAFSAGVLVVKSTSTSGANILMQSAVLTNSGNLTNQLTLSAPTLSSSFGLVLPTIPVSTKIMALDSAGNMSAPYTVDGATITISANVIGVPNAGIGTNQLANSAVNASKIAAGTITNSQLQAGVALVNIGAAGITATYLASNLNLPGNTVQENGKNLVVSNTNTSASLSIIRGQVNGTSNTVHDGEGFTVTSNNGTGTYGLGFTTAFVDLPSVFFSSNDTNGLGASPPTINTLTTSSVSVTFSMAGNINFCFLAIGQRA